MGRVCQDSGEEREARVPALQRERQKEGEMKRQRQTKGQRDKRRDKETERHRDRQAKSQRDRQRDRETGKRRVWETARQ
jgi:hypothetical protein